MRPRLITLRHEVSSDAPPLRRLHERAFGGRQEADLVEAIRRRGAASLSIVAVARGQIVGHVLFTPAEIVGADSGARGVALGPMAVLPEHQSRGIGTALVRRGLELLREAGHGWVVVLGHAAYYPRFGFAPASRFGLRCDWEVPDEVFRALELRPGAVPRGGGRVRYAREFGEV